MFAQTLAQYLILKWVNENCIAASTVLLAPDIVEITDRNGKRMRFSLNINQEIINYDTKEILSR